MRDLGTGAKGDSIVALLRDVGTEGLENGSKGKTILLSNDGLPLWGLWHLLVVTLLGLILWRLW